MSSTPTVYIVIYSLYGHVYTLAKHFQDGLEEQGVHVKLYQVPETLSDAVLEKMHGTKLELPVITAEELKEADAIVWGIPTRFGSVPAQVKSFLDSTGSLWANGELSGKPTSVFFSTGSQHGGQESTVYNAIPYFAHHGMLYVPLGFANANMFDNSEPTGSSAWGSGTIAGSDGSRQVSDKEKEITLTQAKNFANVVIAMQKGKAALQQSSAYNISAKSSSTQQRVVAQEEKNQGVKPKDEHDRPNPIAPAKEEKPSASSKPHQTDKKEKTPSKCFCM